MNVYDTCRLEIHSASTKNEVLPHDAAYRGFFELDYELEHVETL